MAKYRFTKQLFVEAVKWEPPSKDWSVENDNISGQFFLANYSLPITEKVVGGKVVKATLFTHDKPIELKPGDWVVFKGEDDVMVFCDEVFRENYELVK